MKVAAFPSVIPPMSASLTFVSTCIFVTFSAIKTGWEWKSWPKPLTDLHLPGDHHPINRGADHRKILRSNSAACGIVARLTAASVTFNWRQRAL